MSEIFRKTYLAFGAALIVGTSGVSADESCAPACDTCCGEWVLSADLLYWRACEDGFGCDFGTTNITTTVINGQIVTTINENDKDIHFDWDLGFRIGAGYSSNSWDIGLYWTHFNEHGHGHAGANRAHWRLRFNEVDGILGYKLQYCDCFTFRPFLGVRYARINQKLRTNLQSTITITATNASSIALSTKRDREHFWGVGPLLGLEGDLDIGCGFSLYGTLAGNFLYGKFKSKFNDSDIFTAAVSNCFSSAESCAVLTGFDAGLGLRYEFCWLTLQVGWEQHTFFDYNKIGCNGDLNLYGLDVSAIVKF